MQSKSFTCFVLTICPPLPVIDIINSPFSSTPRRKLIRVRSLPGKTKNSSLGGILVHLQMMPH